MGLTEIEAKKLCALLQAAWPNYPWRTESWAAYQLGLSDVPYAVAEAAISVAIRTRTFCPVPAELRAIALEHATGALPTVEAAWEEVSEQARILWPHQTPAFSHDLISRAVKIIGWRDIVESEKPAIERKHFMDIYASLREQAVGQITRGALPGGTVTPIADRKAIA